MKKCIFCKNIRKLSKEHIIPRWLLEELGLLEKDVVMEHSSFFGISLSRRTHSFKSFTNAMICEKCNNGWMSKLEASVKGLIIKLMNLDFTGHEGEIIQSLIKNYAILAKWAFKTAIVLNYPTNYRNIVPVEHFHELYISKIPTGVYINLALTTNSEAINWRQSQTIYMIGMPKNISRLKEVYKITLQFRHLLLRVCYVPFENFIQGDKGETSIALWPEFCVYKEFKAYKDIDEFHIRNYFLKVRS